MAEAIRKVGCVDFGNRSSTLQNRERNRNMWSAVVGYQEEKIVAALKLSRLSFIR